MGITNKKNAKQYTVATCPANTKAGLTGIWPTHVKIIQSAIKSQKKTLKSTILELRT
jgi:hypothetical protein